jgi:hypothetical protein
VVARIRYSSNPNSNLNANFAGEREDSKPKESTDLSLSNDSQNLMGLGIFVYLSQYLDYKKKNKDLQAV